MILPIFGSGQSNITFENMKMIYSFDFEEVKKNGLTYIALKNSHVDVNLGRANIHLENLFNGDKLLGCTTSGYVKKEERLLHWSKSFLYFGDALKLPLVLSGLWPQGEQ
ncbi:unnamed protein product, partial [Timema podura]|nr:unnamed protein product [Timema podura]